MPGRDQTGPFGEGPLTGGGWGPCAGTASRRPGRGRGYRNRFNATGVPFGTRDAQALGPDVDSRDEVAGLRDEVAQLRSTLADVEQHLKRLDRE